MKSKDGMDYFHNYDFVVKWLAGALVGRSLDVLGVKTAPVEWEKIKMLDIVEIAREKGIEEGKTLGIEEGGLGAAREMILDLLFDRFGIMAVNIQEEMGKIESLRVLKALQLQAYRCADLESFKAMLDQVGEASKPEKTQAPRIN